MEGEGDSTFTICVFLSHTCSFADFTVLHIQKHQDVWQNDKVRLLRVTG